MFLETERLVLRKFREEDFADFREYAMDPEMCRMMGRDDMPDTAAARLNFDWLMNKEKRSYVIVYKENSKVIGNLTVTNVSPALQSRTELEGKNGCSLSFCVSRHYQRRGLMLEALSGVIDHLFQAEGIDYINCGYFSFNIASRELQKKLGFSYLATEHFNQDGRDIEAIENILWRESWGGCMANTCNF